METSINKETFKLLKISDDSKSCSELDLPQITSQRKRKVRRKTRPRLVSSNNIHPDVSTTSSRQCSALVLWIVLFIICCWLITISYMLAVIHSENLRLEVEIKKLSITTQDLPESLQQWHETSKKLEQNQTALHIKITELRQTLNGMFLQLSAKVDETKDYTEVQKWEAKFGASIEAVENDIEKIKARIAGIQKNHTLLVTLNSTINDTFSQKTKNLTDEINNQKKLFASIEQDKIDFEQKLIEVITTQNKSAEDISDMKKYFNQSISDIHKYFDKKNTEINQKFELNYSRTPSILKPVKNTKLEITKSTVEPILSTPLNDKVPAITETNTQNISQLTP